MKMCNNKHLKWVYMAPLVFWANQVTVCQLVSYSPYFMAHGVEVVLPLDIVEATYLLPPLDVPTTTKDLIAHHAQQLQKRPEDLCEMLASVLKARKQLAAQFVKCFSSTILEYDFEVGSLVLVYNSCIEKELNHKTKPHFLGPMVVVHHTKGGAYILVQLNGAISRLQYAAFRIIPYLARFPDHIPVTSLLDDAELEDIQLRSESFPPADELPDDTLFDD